VKYVTDSKVNISIHLFQAYRPGMGKEELKDKTIEKLRELDEQETNYKFYWKTFQVSDRIPTYVFPRPVGPCNHWAKHNSW